MSLAALADFQDALVELSEEGYAHLRDSILEHGIIDPILYWCDPAHPDAPPMILGGHQRKKVVLGEGWRLAGDGWPVVEIQAPTEQAAAKILLQLRGQHGHLTMEGLFGFIMAKDLPMEDLEAFDLPGFDMDDFQRIAGGADIDTMDVNLDGDDAANAELDLILRGSAEKFTAAFVDEIHKIAQRAGITVVDDDPSRPKRRYWGSWTKGSVIKPE